MVHIVEGALGQVALQQFAVLGAGVQLDGAVHLVAGKDCPVHLAVLQPDGGQNSHHGLIPDVQKGGVAVAAGQHVVDHVLLQAGDHLLQRAADKGIPAAFQRFQHDVIALGHPAGAVHLNVTVGGVVQKRVDLGVGPLVHLVGHEGGLGVLDGIVEGIVAEIQKQAGAARLPGHVHGQIAADDHVRLAGQRLAVHLLIFLFGAVGKNLQIHPEQHAAAAGVTQHVAHGHQRHPGPGLHREPLRLAQQQADALRRELYAHHRHIQIFPDAQRLQATADQDSRPVLNGGAGLLHRVLGLDLADLGDGIMPLGQLSGLKDQIVLGQKNRNVAHNSPFPAAALPA